MTGIKSIQHNTIFIKEIINRFTIYYVCGVNGVIILVFITARHANTVVIVRVCYVASERVVARR